MPTLLQEQNSYAGVTNKLPAKKAKAICVAYDGMDRFFPAASITKTGNPVRTDLENCTLTGPKPNGNSVLIPKSYWYSLLAAVSEPAQSTGR